MQRRAASKTYGTVPAERQKEMTGLQFVAGLADGTLPLNTIARTLGYTSEYAFNRAFTRYRRTPPGRYRSQARLAQPPAVQTARSASAI